MRNISKRLTFNNPWGWIPTLYIAEGLPYFAVNVLTVMMFTQMQIGLKEMALYTGWLYLPWVIKPFWSPFVDVISTKRRWVIIMQGCLALSMAAVAFFIPTPFFFQATLCAFWIMAFCSATHDIAADGYYMLALTTHEQALYVGARSTFYRIASVIGQGGLVWFAGMLQQNNISISTSWSIVFIVLSIFFLVMTIWHTFAMPRPAADVNHHENSIIEILRRTISTFITFFCKPGILVGIFFMLLYRLPEAMCIKMVQPFLIAPIEQGGLGLSAAEVGIVNGVIGVIALLGGGILGGIAIARYGLRRCLWPMAAALALPCIAYCLLAMYQPSSMILICTAISIEQFGYGFGFTAYMLYMIYISRGENKTSHYAYCTAFMALGMMLPGMAAGWIYEQLSTLHIFGTDSPQGFINFFWWVMICCLFTFAACIPVRIDRNFGLKQS